jgi:hypothetical protein
MPGKNNSNNYYFSIYTQEETMFNKKSTIVTIAVIMIIGFALFPGCDKSTDSSGDNGNNNPPSTSLIGTWNLISIILEINEVLTEVPAALAGIEMTLIVRTDSTFEATVTQDGETETQTGTYTKTDSTITLNYTGGGTELLYYHFEGSNLMVETVIPMDLDEDGIDENVQVTMKFGKT